MTAERRVVRRFTNPEDDLITALRIEQKSLGQIARLTDRAKSSIQMRLVALAERAENEHDR